MLPSLLTGNFQIHLKLLWKFEKQVRNKIYIVEKFEQQKNIIVSFFCKGNLQQLLIFANAELKIVW